MHSPQRMQRDRKILFIERPGRTQQAFMAFWRKSGSAARQRNQRNAGS